VREALTTVRDSARGGSPLHACSETALARLAERARKPLAIVVAPAGFGKSTLLREFAARHAAVLIDLTVGAATLRDLVRRLCESLRDVAPGARLAFTSAYTRAAERGQRTTSLARWLGRYLEGANAVAVVDGVHRLGEETQAFGEFAEALVRQAPGLRLVIGTRDDAGLPIPRWFADELTGIPVGADDLRWGVDEARSYARRSALDHDEAVLERVVRAAHGRPFDVIYALRTGRNAAAADEPGTALFRSLARDERAYVLETCLLESMDAPVLAAAGLGVHPLLEGGSRLRELIVSRHGEDGYRYDDALRLCAQTVLRADPAAYARVAARTTGALACAGRVREALELACNASLLDRVSALVREHGLELEDRGDGDAIDAALDVLPDDVDDAVVLLLRATRESRLGRIDTSEAWFRHALARADTRALSAEAAYRLGREIVRRERGDAVELLEPYANDESLGAAHRCAIGAVLAEAYLIAHRPDDARRALSAALAYADDLDVPARAHLFARASYVEFYGGDRAKARDYAMTGASLAEEANLYVIAIGSYSVLYNIAYEDAGPSEALVYLERLGECSIRAGNVDFHLYALTGAYEAHVERGDVAALERLDHSLREFDVHYGAASALQGLLPCRALVTAWSGAFASAYELLAASGFQQQADPDREALRWAEIALYAAAAGMTKPAEDALRSFSAAFASDGGSTQYAERGAIVARLAAALVGAPADWPVRAASAGRIGALARGVETVIRRREGRAGPGELLDALDDLRRHELAGMAKLFAALPAAAVNG
jgi:ATP/maltotriose-dependent transcriptional regulator MalT